MDKKAIRLGEKSIREEITKLSDEELAKVLEQSNNWHDYVRNTSLMNGIAREMKEIAELPSEKIDDKQTSPLRQVEFPKEGGILTYMDNYDYPYKGYPFYEFVDKIDIIKKISRSFISGLYHQLKGRNKLAFISLIPAMWVAKDSLRAGIYTMYRVIERFRMKPERYSTAVRELYRAFGTKDEFTTQVRDLVCMILEFDNAYRFRFQDIIVELDKGKLEKNVAKELIRLFSIMQSRELGQEVSDTWKLAKYAVLFYLRFDRSLQRIIKETLFDLDIEKVKLAVEDKVYCIPRKDYTFGFVSNPDLTDSKLLAIASLREAKESEQEKIKKESTRVHEDMMKSQEKEKDKKLRDLDNHYSELIRKAEERYTLEKRKLSLNI